MTRPDPVIVVHPDRQSLADAAGARLVTAILDAQAARGRAQLALTGGSMGSAILTSAAAVAGRSAVDWSLVDVWWGDERYLPAGDPDRNDTQNDAGGLGSLGLHPDHVASHFPHHPAQRATGALAVAVHDSPKPPPDRVTLTFECLRRSREVWFLVAGDDKAGAVAAALAPGADRWDVPASGPAGTDATRWLIDRTAASRLPPEAHRATE